MTALRPNTNVPSEVLGPNTNAPPGLLHERCILCAGEDPDVLCEALRKAGDPERVPTFRYRGYAFWRFSDFCVVLSGIGTGCLEPLLHEVLLYELDSARLVRRVVLIGTAGSMPDIDVKTGEAYLIDKAWAAGTGIDAEAEKLLPLQPRSKPPQGVPRASSVSTDFYYGFSKDILSGKYPTKGKTLRKLFKKHKRQATQLVDMEVAQFYYFCECFGDSSLQYAAVKAPANAVGNHHQQLDNTLQALGSCLTTAFLLLFEGSLDKSPLESPTDLRLR
jgi:purine-nucleoside phosphorylase